MPQRRVVLDHRVQLHVRPRVRHQVGVRSRRVHVGAHLVHQLAHVQRVARGAELDFFIYLKIRNKRYDSGIVKNLGADGGVAV